MRQTFDASTKKKPTNLSLNANLLAEAKDLNINLSATMERALIAEVRQQKAEQWRQKNVKGIDDCNKVVEENGLFSDAHRHF